MQTVARPIQPAFFPPCPLGDKCVTNANQHVKHDHRFEENHQVWFNVAQTMLDLGKIWDGMTKSQLSVVIDNFLKGVDYGIKGNVRDYARTLIEVRNG